MSAFTIDYTVWWGYVWGCSQQVPSAKLEARPLGLRTCGAWAPAWGLGTHNAYVTLGLPTCVLADQEHKWRLGSCLSAGHTPTPIWHLGSCLSAGHTLCTHGAWNVCLGARHPQRTRDVWAALGVSHACAPLGDTWSLGHGAGPKVPRSYDSKYYCFF